MQVQWYPCGVKGMDRCGRPLFIKLYSDFNPKELIKHASSDQIGLWEAINGERLRALHTLNSREVGWHVEDNCILLDCNKLQLKNFNGYTRAMMKEAGRLIEPNYPENLGLSILFNAPWYITTIWAFAKLLMPKRTVTKFQILGSNYKKTLLKLIDPKYLPVEYGGTGELGFHSRDELFFESALEVFRSDDWMGVHDVIGCKGRCVEDVDPNKVVVETVNSSNWLIS